MSMSMSFKRFPPKTIRRVTEFGIDVTYRFVPAVRGARDEGRLLEPNEESGPEILAITLFGKDILNHLPQEAIDEIEAYLK